MLLALLLFYLCNIGRLQVFVHGSMCFYWLLLQKCNFG
jgi:hypothetical protein